jgi:hypothetical protein
MTTYLKRAYERRTLSARKALTIALIFTAFFLLLSPPCPADTTFSVQITYAGAAGGVGLCLYLCYSFGSDFWSTDMMPAVINLRRGQMVVGVPAVEYEHGESGFSFRPVEAYSFRLFRWEF